MSILDVKFKNGQAFLLKHHGIGLQEYESQISKIEYEHIYERYRLIKDIYGVEKEMFPPVNMVFFSYLFMYQKVPDTYKLLEEYFQMYQNYFFEEADEGIILYNRKKYKKEALIARILRTYPSLIKDFHFYLLLMEDRYFQDVIYSCKIDIKGNDIVIRCNNNEYVLSLFVDTGRSRFYKDIKNRFRHKYSDNEICVPLDFSRARKIGDFFVYTQDDVENVKIKITDKNLNTD